MAVWRNIGCIYASCDTAYSVCCAFPHYSIVTSYCYDGTMRSVTGALCIEIDNMCGCGSKPFGVAGGLDGGLMFGV